MDLDIKRYKTYEELEQYCYRVASVVGLAERRNFWLPEPGSAAITPSHLGKALQLTNILRDVRNDAERGRIYLPLAELERHKVSPEEILRLEYSERFERLAASVASQAKKFYAEAGADVAAGGPALDDRGGIDGFGLLASVAGTGAPAFQRLQWAAPCA